MLNGYVTYDELKLITGYNDSFLSKLISKGLNLHEADLDYDVNKPKKTSYKMMLFNLQEVEDWLRVHIF